MSYPLLGNWRGRPVKIWGQKKTPSGPIYRCKQLFQPYGYVNLPVTEVLIAVPLMDREKVPHWGDDVDEFLSGSAMPINETARFRGPSNSHPPVQREVVISQI